MKTLIGSLILATAALSFSSEAQIAGVIGTVSIAQGAIPQSINPVYSTETFDAMEMSVAIEQGAKFREEGVRREALQDVVSELVNSGEISSLYGKSIMIGYDEGY